jgi:hypothetical protein
LFFYDPSRGHYRSAKAVNRISECFQLPKGLIEVVVCEDFKMKLTAPINWEIVASVCIGPLETMALVFESKTLWLGFPVWVLRDLFAFVTISTFSG